MNEKINILSYLLDNNILSPTPSRVAKEIGLSDKKLLYGRLTTQAVREETVNDIWKRILYNYNISEYTLLHLPNLWNLSNQMAETLAIENFIDLCQSKLDSIKDNQLKDNLRVLKRESLLDYFYVLGLFYAKVSGYNVNTAKNSQMMIEILLQIDVLLHKKYPEGEIAHQVVQEYISKAERAKFLGWTLLMLFAGYVIGCYTHPLFINQMHNEKFPPIELDPVTWWQEPDATDEQVTLWRMSNIDECCSIYNVIVIKANRNRTITPEDCVTYRIGFQSPFGWLQLGQNVGDKKTIVSFYFYQLTDDNQTLSMTAYKTLSGKKPLPMPAQLKRIDPKLLCNYGIQPNNYDNINAIERTLNMANQGIEDTNMNVVDVTITRNSCTLHIQQNNNGIKSVRLDISEDSTLRHITVWDEVCIIREKATNKLYAWWEQANIRIGLPEGVF
ncbi:MAG: hypothetical protein MJZ75_04795 [Paludibacteraceae bacterium]|nr:hypothetical protein [Paludibacteraceae bacterium]